MGAHESTVIVLDEGDSVVKTESIVLHGIAVQVVSTAMGAVFLNGVRIEKATETVKYPFGPQATRLKNGHE